MDVFISTKGQSPNFASNIDFLLVSGETEVN